MLSADELRERDAMAWAEVEKKGVLIATFIYDYMYQPGSSGFRGRPRTTLPRSINNDLKNSRSTNSLTSHEDLVALRQLAQDRRKWKELMCAVCNG